MEDSMERITWSLRKDLFMWEAIITIIVFVAAFYIFKGFKNKENAAKARNKKYSKGNDMQN